MAKGNLPGRFQRLEKFIGLKKGADNEGIEEAKGDEE